MPRKWTIKKQLRDLSEGEMNYTRYLLLGEIIREIIPPDHPISKSYSLLESRRSKRSKASPSPDFAQAKEIAIGVQSLVEKLGFPKITSQSDDQERETLYLVNQAFYNSNLFAAAKWILATSLLLLGIGSLGFAGFNIYAQDRLRVAQDQLNETTSKMNALTKSLDDQRIELQEKQKDVVNKIEKAISDYSGAAERSFKSVLAKAETDLNGKIADATAYIGDQKRSLDDKVKTILSDINQRKASFDSEAGTSLKEVTEFLNGQKQSVNGKAIAALDEANKQIESSTVKATSQIENEGKVGIDTIRQRSEKESSSLGAFTEGKKVDLDSALQKNTQALDEVLKVKLADLNNKWTEASKRLDSIGTDAVVREKQFGEDLYRRLSVWDQQVSIRQARLDQLNQQANDQESKLRRFSQRIEGLQSSAGAALEIAATLADRTSTNDLYLIGVVLEKSAGLVIANTILAIISVILSVWTFFVIYRDRRQHGRPPSVAPTPQPAAS